MQQLILLMSDKPADNNRFGWPKSIFWIPRTKMLTWKYGDMKRTDNVATKNIFSLKKAVCQILIAKRLLNLKAA